MNDDQRASMLAELGKLFDQAATTCSHCGEAALKIERGLREAGFAIIARKARK